MSRVRNAAEFIRLVAQAGEDYRLYYRPQIEKIRARYAGSGNVPPEVDESLEAHMREYFVNRFLNALNWRMEASPHEGLPNLTPEAPVVSTNEGTTRFLDYLGTEGEENIPLLIVETKRPSSRLPKRKKAVVKNTKETPSEVICAGLAGEDLGKDWNEWLATLRDYVQSVRDQTGFIPKRVVSTNGHWLIIFSDLGDSFLESGSRQPANVFVYEEGRKRRDGTTSPDQMEERYEEVFELLEYHLVRGKVPSLTPGTVAFYVRPELIDRATHGLYVRYIEQQNIYSVAPVITVSPVLFLHSRSGTWMHIESRREEQIPHSQVELLSHLDRINQVAMELLATVNRNLGTDFVSAPLEDHYQDSESFNVQSGVVEIRRGTEYLVMTGEQTHYLLPEPTVRNCPHHNWANSDSTGVAHGDSPITRRSTRPRSFFVTSELHHCAHREVAAAKASPIPPSNREICGLRSGQNLAPFCEIWPFEEHLCCRTCAFQYVCLKAQVFHLPC